eukprot:TRINITY_DN17485_c0_g2_i1.p1 TRINITY_DN17485_c0_g2~~TRINITY_DN17485_c0_g2_i1.p1  ORF type:complete len:600 (+),score=175.28 TRINITY_DN17485_c0_g2_i1:26-1801(+)
MSAVPKRKQYFIIPRKAMDPLKYLTELKVPALEHPRFVSGKEVLKLLPQCKTQMDLIDLCSSLSPPIDSHTLPALDSLLLATHHSSITSISSPILLSFLTSHQHLLPLEPTFSLPGSPFFLNLLKDLLYASKDFPKATLFLNLLLLHSLPVPPELFLFYLRYCLQHHLYRAALQFHSQLLSLDHYILRTSNPVVEMFAEMYAKKGDFVAVRDVWRRVKVKDMESWNAMVVAYARAGCVEEAEGLLKKEKEKERWKISSETWNALIKAFFARGEWEKALEVFYDMERYGLKPNGICWSIMIVGLFKNRHIDIGRKCFKEARESKTMSAIDWQEVLEICFRCRTFFLIRQVTEDMVNNLIPQDTILWTFLIRGYFNCGDVDTALDCFETAKEIIVPDVWMWETLLKGLFESNEYDKGVTYFRKYQASELKPENSTWAILVRGHLKYSQNAKAFEDIGKMKAHIKPDSNFWNPLLRYLFQQGKPDLALTVLQMMKEEGHLFDSTNWHCIIQGFFTFDSEKAIEMFDLLPFRRVVVSVETWNMVVEELGKLGNLETALNYTKKMKMNGIALHQKVKEQLFKLSTLHNRPIHPIEM